MATMNFQDRFVPVLGILLVLLLGAAAALQYLAWQRSGNDTAGGLPA